MRTFQVDLMLVDRITLEIEKKNRILKCSHYNRLPDQVYTFPLVLNLTGIVTILQLLGLQRRLKSMNMEQSFRMQWIFITLKMK